MLPKFQYSEAEKKEIGDALGEFTPAKIKGLDRDDIELHIRWMEHCANEYVTTFISGNRLKDELEHLAKIIKRIQGLIPLLQRRDITGRTFDEMIYNLVTPPTPFSRDPGLVHDLQEICDESRKLASGIETSHATSFSDKGNPAFVLFIDDLVRCWIFWKKEIPGGSKQGGPASDFVVRAANPVIQFGHKLGIVLRPGSKVKLSREYAGEIIHSLKKQDKEASQAPDGRPSYGQYLRRVDLGEEY